MEEYQEIHQTWLENQIKEIRTYSGIKNTFTMDSKLIEDLHIDSLELLELVTAVEHYTGQPLSDAIWMEWYCLHDIVGYLTQTCHVDGE